MIPAGELQFKQAGKKFRLIRNHTHAVNAVTATETFFFLPRITQGPFDPEVIQSEYSIKDQEIKVRQSPGGSASK